MKKHLYLWDVLDCCHDNLYCAEFMPLKKN